MKRGILVGLAVATWATAHAETITGRVVSISDGDTLTVLAAQRQLKVRINGIDAPEKAQTFGDRSGQSLSAMAFHKDARLECHKTDRYGRKVCKVWVQPSDCPACGKTLDVGHAQVLAGMAWWYRQYARDQSAEDQGRYESSEREARARKWGLWKDSDPVPPWEWRQQKQAAARSGEPARPAVTTGLQDELQVMPPKPFCDRKDVPGKNHADIVCGWR